MRRHCDTITSMSDERQKRGWGIWTAVGVLIFLVIYSLSYAPLVKLRTELWMKGFWDLSNFGVINPIYEPLFWTIANSPAPIGKASDWYFDLWNSGYQTGKPLH